MLGIYDSGVGGLTILQSIQKQHPDLAVRYLADSLNFPLGDKDRSEVLSAVQNALSHLFDQGCQLVVLACNTATCLAIRDIQQSWLPAHYPGRKVLGIVRPVSEGMIRRLNSPGDHFNKVLLMATDATIASGFYQEELARQGLYHVLSMPMNGLAAAIEDRDNSRINRILEQALSSAGPALVGVETVVLACTHYPLAKRQIRQQLAAFGISKEVEILSQADLVSDRFSDYLVRHPELEMRRGSVAYEVNGDPASFALKAKELLGLEVQPHNIQLALD